MCLIDKMIIIVQIFPVPYFYIIFSNSKNSLISNLMEKKLFDISGKQGWKHQWKRSAASKLDVHTLESKQI